MKLTWTAAVLWSVASIAAGLAPATAGAQEKSGMGGMGGLPVGAMGAPTYGMGGMSGMGGDAKKADGPPPPAVMVNYEITDGPAIKAINKPLTDKPGDAKAGEKVIKTTKLGNCFACHEIVALRHKANNDPQGYSDMGQIGPRLDGVATRYTEGELRMLLVDSKKVFPETLMPGFYRNEGLNRVNDAFVGQTILQPQEIEDALAFLAQLNVEPTAGMGGMSGMRAK